ncbi:MAG: ABC transporter permease [Clostridia bacterium]|nr:ABC transporter permease [Clostridia bacterium]
MLRLFFYDLWSNMKRSPIVSLLIFIQIAILSFCITDIFFEKSSSDFNNNAYTGVYLDNTLFGIRLFNADREEVARASAGMFESLENSGLEDYEAFHKIIMGSDDIKTAVMTGTGTNRQPFYKVMYFVMMALIAITVTFLNSYNYQVEHIDRYQNNYWPKSGSVLYFHSLPKQDSDPPELLYNIDGYNDYSIEICMEINYNEHITPKVRGWFYKGNFGVPEITQGRFFTEDEVRQISDYAVAGKNVLADFGFEKDGKQYITYKDHDYEVIGTVGRTGHNTSIDDWVFLTLPTVINNFGTAGRPVIVDAKNPSAQIQIIEYLKSSAAGRYTYMEQPVQARIDIGIPKDAVDIFIAVIFITAVVFCVYFTDKLKQQINIKNLSVIPLR